MNQLWILLGSLMTMRLYVLLKSNRGQEATMTVLAHKDGGF